MTDKQIIIDDCIHLDEWKHCDICEKLIKTKDGANGKKRKHLLIEEDLRCDFYPSCHYKQLKRKEQEYEELKEKCRKYGEINEQETKDYAELKAENEELKKYEYHYLDKYIQLKETLAEIKEIAWVNPVNTCWESLNLCDKCEEKEDCELQSPFAKLKLIIEKINEVKDANNNR